MVKALWHRPASLRSECLTFIGSLERKLIYARLTSLHYKYITHLYMYRYISVLLGGKLREAFMSAFIQAQSSSYMDDLTYSKRNGLNLFEGNWKISLTGALIMVYQLPWFWYGWPPTFTWPRTWWKLTRFSQEPHLSYLLFSPIKASTPDGHREHGNLGTGQSTRTFLLDFTPLQVDCSGFPTCTTA